MEIKSEGKSIKEMLAAGVDPACMIKDLQNQILAAQKELRQEQEQEKKKKDEERRLAVDIAKKKVLYALKDFAVAIGFISEDDEKIKEFIKTGEKVLDDIEREYSAIGSAIDYFKKSRVNKTKERDERSIEEVLDQFLRGL